MDRKKEIAMASAFIAGGLMFYFMKDVFEDLLEGEKRDNEIKEKNLEEDYIIGLNEEKIRSFLGNRYPGNNMWKIYPYLPIDFIKKWRRGIVRMGTKTGMDMQFVYVDGSVLSKNYSNEILKKALDLYNKNIIRFKTLEDEYINFLKNRPELI